MADTPRLGFKEATKLNWQESGIPGKAGRLIGSGVGVIIVGKGLKDLGRVVGVVSPKLDDEGKEIPAGGGTLVKSLAELAAGAGVIYVSLAKFAKGQGAAPAIG